MGWMPRRVGSIGRADELARIASMTNLRYLSVICPVLCAVFCVLADGAEIRVPDPGDSIQAAIELAVDGDSVTVGPGTYLENLDFLGKAITLISDFPDEPCRTIIDGSGAAPDDPNKSVVLFIHQEGPDSVVDGFTIRGGTGMEFGPFSWGGGMFFYGAGPTIQNCIIRDNSAL